MIKRMFLLTVDAWIFSVISYGNNDPCSTSHVLRLQISLRIGVINKEI